MKISFHVSILWRFVTLYTPTAHVFSVLAWWSLCVRAEADGVSLAAFQTQEQPAEGGRGAPQSQVQLHHPDLWHLQRARVLLHHHRVHEQWLPGPVAPRGRSMSSSRFITIREVHLWIMILFKKIATFLGYEASLHSQSHATFLFRHFSERGFLKRALLLQSDRDKIRCVLSIMAFVPVGQPFLQQHKVKLGSCHSLQSQQGKRDAQ